MGLTTRMPVYYIPHGGGPWPYMDAGKEFTSMWEPLRRFLTTLIARLPEIPRAILCISSHWEEEIPTLQTAPEPSLYYDYYGFPPETYQIAWPARTSTNLAAQVRRLLGQGGFTSGEDSQRGYDHGAFIPLSLMVPKADIPVLQLSLLRGLDPRRHIMLGQALEPLRDEGILILGSGMSSHNLRRLGDPAMAIPSREFDTWIRQSIALESNERLLALANWQQAPHARDNHPREEHLLPLHVAAGAGAKDEACIIWSGEILGTLVSAVRFG